jgi:hypothetical protein
VEKGPIAAEPPATHIDEPLKSAVITKSPIQTGPITAYRDEQRKGPYITMVPVIENAAAPTYDRMEVSRRRVGPAFVAEAEIKPEFFRKSALMSVLLVGGPSDGTVVERSQETMRVQLSVPRTEPVPKCETELAGRHSVVAGEYDCATYKRTNQKTEDGMRVFEFVAPGADVKPVPDQPALAEA